MIAQSVEHAAVNRGVVGSSPTQGVEILSLLKFIYGPMAQLVRAPPCHGGGRRFESDSGRFYAVVAEQADARDLKSRG